MVLMQRLAGAAGFFEVCEGMAQFMLGLMAWPVWAAGQPTRHVSFVMVCWSC